MTTYSFLPNFHRQKHSRRFQTAFWRILIVVAVIAGLAWWAGIKIQNWWHHKKAQERIARERAEEEAKNKILLAIQQEATTLKEEPEAEEFFQVGQKYLQQQKYDWAVVAFELACQKDEFWREPPTFLGYAYLQLDQPQKAQLALQRAVEIDPLYGLAHYLLGQTFWQLKRKDLAQEEFKKAQDFGFDTAKIGSD